MRYACILLVSSTIALTAAPAGPQQAGLAFEVASIRTNRSGDGSTTFRPLQGTFSAVNATVMQLMRFAFDVQAFQIAGGPSWIREERFDIDAKAPAGVAADQTPVWQELLRQLLSDRFKLTHHMERTERSVYALVVVKGGHRLESVPMGDGEPERTGFRARAGEVLGDRVSMDALAFRLSRSLGQPVVNRTELSGLFNMTLRWTPDAGLTARPGDAAPQDGGPSIFTAIQEQLGLRLQPANGFVDVLVIDRVERPNEN